MIARGRGDDRPVGERLRQHQRVVLVPGGLAAGNQAGNRVVPLPDGERRLGVGGQRVGEEPPCAELVVERCTVGGSGFSDAVTVEQRQAEEELRLEGQRAGVVRAGSQRGGPLGVGQRLAVPALPPDRDQQRRQGPHRDRRVTRLLGDGQGSAGGRFAPTMIAGEGQCPALLSEHRHLFKGSKLRADEAGLRDGDELSGTVLERQRAYEAKAQRGVHLGRVLASEHRFRAGRRLRHLAGAQQRSDDLGRDQIRVAMPAWQQRLGSAHELGRDQRRLSRRVAGGVSQPCDRLLVTSLCAANQVISDVQGIRARGPQRDRRLPVQETAGRRRHVLIDRVVHELMPKYDPVANLVEQSSVERGVELRDDLGRPPAGDRGDIAKRHRIAEHRRNLQQRQRPLRQVPQAANHQVTHRSWELRGRCLDEVPRRAQQSFVGQRAQHGHGPQWVPARLAQQRGQGGAGRRAKHMSGRAPPPRLTSAAGAARCARPRPRDRRAAGPPRPTGAKAELSPRRATPRAAAAEPLTRSPAGWRCPPSGHPRPPAAPGARRTRSPPGPRSPRRPGRRCRPRRRRLDVLASQQTTDRRPARVRRPPVQVQRGSNHTERPGALERMSLAAEDGHTASASIIDQTLAPSGSCRCQLPPRS